jgi:hypothetical protein
MTQKNRHSAGGLVLTPLGPDPATYATIVRRRQRGPIIVRR